MSLRPTVDFLLHDWLDVQSLQQRRNLFRDEYTQSTLRGHLGLARPSNRFATGKAGVA